MTQRTTCVLYLAGALVVLATQCDVILSKDASAGTNQPFVNTKDCPRKPDQIQDRKCFKKCRRDADCRGRSKRCLCDDVCGKSCVKPTKRCQELKPIFNGNYEITPYNTFAATARYTCNLNYVLSGSPERVCQGDGYWSGEPPECEPENSFPGLSGNCPEPPVVLHATHGWPGTQKVFPLGTQLTYSCTDGYNLDGYFRAMCVGEGRWYGPIMKCTPRQCPHPGDISNGRREGTVFIFPSRVTYVCAEGYRMVGRPYRICQAAGKWSGNLPSCKPVTCERLPSPVNGQNHGSGLQFGAEVSFTCYHGFELMGSRIRVCGKQGAWSGTETSCRQVDCGHPGPFYDGSIDVISTTYGSTAVFTCFDHTTLVGVTQAACDDSGRWSDPPPICWRQCRMPEVAHGYVRPQPSVVAGHYVDHNKTLALACERGYELTDAGLALRPCYNTTCALTTCHNGTWTVLPRCMPGACQPPRNDLPDGIVRYHGVRHDDRAKYFCNPGFELKGDPYRVCQFQTWRGHTPTCLPKYCDYPGVIVNGQILLVGAIGKYEFRPYVRHIGHNEQIEYQCDKSFKRVGPAAATCVDGEWSPAEKPYCAPGQHPNMFYVFRGKRAASGSRGQTSGSRGQTSGSRGLTSAWLEPPT